MINVGIIGTGFGVTGQLASFKQIEGCNVIAICGKDPDKTSAIARDHHVQNAYSDYHQLLSNPNIDLVTMPVPNELHYPLFLEALKSNKHLVVEKPAGVSSAEIKYMIDTAKTHTKLIVVDHPLRFNPIIIEIKKLINEQSIGDVTAVMINQYTNYGSDDANPHRWHDTKKSGGGQILLMGTHIIDLCRHLLNMPKMMKGSVMKQRIKSTKSAPDGTIKPVDVEEQITGTFLFENNVITTFFNTLYSFGYKNFELRVHGTKGVLFYDDYDGLRISTANNEPLKSIQITDHLSKIIAGRSFVSSSFKYFAYHLISQLNGSPSAVPFCTLSEAYDNMKYLEQLDANSNF